MASHKATLSVGLLSLPVRLEKANQETPPAFKQIHPPCLAEVGRKNYCKGCGNEVGSDEIAKGYALGGGEYILVTEEDLEALPGAIKRVVQIDQFVDPEEIDPVMFLGRSYYIQPEDASKKACGIVLAGMLAEGKAAVARLAFRENRERLALIRARGDMLVLDLMFWPNEVRAAGEGYDVSGGTKAEANLARQLIVGLWAPFDPNQYSDKYREQLMEVVEAKVAGTEPVAVTTAPAAPVVDFMDALKASIEQTSKAKGREVVKETPTRKASARRKKAS